MATYRLHGFGRSGNTYKVAMYLATAGLDWEPVFVSVAAGDTRDPAWRAKFNPMGEIPVLEVGGRFLTQSGAILMELAETTGHYAAATAEERPEVMRWILWDNHKFTNYFAMHRLQKAFAPQPPPPEVLAWLRSHVEQNLALLESHLAGRTWVVGNRPTIADLSLAGYMYYPTAETGFDLAATHPSITAWTHRIAALPGWLSPYDMLPGGVPTPLR
ncbi:MAG: glutathione S-transferase [Hyphomicrobium sp.]